MTANTYFEISALAIMLVFLLHVNFNKIIKSASNRFFVWFAVFGTLCISCDVITRAMLTYPELYSVGAQKAGFTVLYILQATIAYAMYLYVVSLRNGLNQRALPYIIGMSIPYGAMVICLFMNLFTGIIFSYDSSGTYTSGGMFNVLYIHCFYYMVLGLCSAVIFRKRIGAKRALVVVEVILICLVCALVQMLYTGLRLVGVGVAIAVIVLMLTIQNPNGKIDNLTGAYAITGLKEVLDLCGLKKQNIWLVTIAIDNLKRINHVFGLKYGDDILVRLCKRLSKIAGDEQVFRFTGDKFAIILYSEKDYYYALSEIKEHFRQTVAVGGMEIQVSACICGFPLNRKVRNTEEMLALMDYTISKTKCLGAGSILMVDDDIVREFKRSRQIEEYLYTAIEKNLFEVCYQPIYSLKDECFVSVESLVRLNHPTLGAISPSEFIPISERSGQINLIDGCVFRKVCSFVLEHPEIKQQLRSMKFNVSPADFLGSKLSVKMLEVMDSYKVDPKFFQFEITETAATVYEQELSAWVADMKRIGVGLCLDDFGSGYANLDVVVKLPFDVIKIDRSMLIAAMQSKRAETLYANVFTTMNALGFEVVAEGAETRSQIDYLEKLGVNYIQGFYYCQPMEGEELLKLLKEQNKPM